MIEHLSSKLFVKHKKLLLLALFIGLASPALAQEITVLGTVKDATGPLPGVSVIVKGTSNGASTDFDGNYSLSNVPTNATLLFSYVGFIKQEIPLNGRSSIDVVLVEDLQALDEVVVVGYGSMQRSNVTGSIVTVDVEELQKVPLPNPIEALRGRVAGLQVTRGSGQPGAGVTFKIRGTNSLGAVSGDIDGNNQPILVIDGVPIPGGNLNEINPSDIESINVLKDAAAAAIYGSQGANGAILITTKNGKKGLSKITLNFYTGFVDLANRIDMMNGDQYVRYLFDSAIQNGTTNPQVQNVLTNEELNNYVNGRDYDWQELLIGTGIQNNLSIGTSGGGENYSFYINGDAYKEEGIITASDYERYSVRLNADFKPKEWFKIGARVQLTKSFSDETSNIISEFNVNGGFAPFLPISTNTPLGNVFNEDGTYTKFLNGDQFQINPLHRYNESVVDRNVTRSYINPYINIDIIEGLTYTLNTFAENRQEFFGRFQSSDYGDQDPSEAQIAQSTNKNYLLDNILTYNRDFGKHSVNATAVYGMQKFEFEGSDLYADNLPTDLLGYNAIGDALNSQSELDWNTDENGRVYMVGRIGYGYDSRYNFTMTLRRDGSSKFGENYKYGNFPSISFAWNAHNELFLKDVDFLDMLKLRVSYGVLGNDNIGTYLYRAGTNNIQLNIGVDENGNDIVFNGYGVGNNASNPNLRWEESQQQNIGVDFGFLKNILTGSIDVWKTNTKDVLLFETIIPVNGGFSQYPSNVGEVENKGIDIGLGASIFDKGDFTWKVNLNWSKDQNQIVRLSRGDVNEEGEPVDNPANGWFIGQDIREIYDYKFLGVWQLGEEDEASAFGQVPGDPIIADSDGSGVIDANDRTFLGNPTPDWYGGINSVTSYKGFELSVLVETVQGVTRVNNYIGNYTGRGNQLNINYWTPENPSNEFTRVGSNGGLAGPYSAAIRVRDASFVALRNVSLGYDLPSKFIDKTPFSKVNLYVRGNNLKYWTDYDNAFSPESGVGSYPITRTWVFGTNLTF